MPVRQNIVLTHRPEFFFKMHKMHYTPIISPADSSQQYNKTSKEITRKRSRCKQQNEGDNRRGKPCKQKKENRDAILSSGPYRA